MKRDLQKGLTFSQLLKYSSGLSKAILDPWKETLKRRLISMERNLQKRPISIKRDLQKGLISMERDLERDSPFRNCSGTARG